MSVQINVAQVAVMAELCPKFVPLITKLVDKSFEGCLTATSEARRWGNEIHGYANDLYEVWEVADMPLDKSRKPEPRSYYESEGLWLGKGNGWVTTTCSFHGGSDSMRINLTSGAFVCMAGCGARGGDVLAYHMATYGMGFVDAAKALGCWVEGGAPCSAKPTPFTARQALEVLAAESNLVAITAGNIAYGVLLSRKEKDRVLLAANRIATIKEVFA